MKLFRHSLVLVLLAAGAFGQCPAQTTLADLTAAKLDACYALPAPYAAGTAPSTEFSTYNSDSYIKSQNRDVLGVYAVNVANQRAFNQFDFAARQWEMNKSATLPAAPQYVKLDPVAWDKAWAQYCAIVTACFGGDQGALAKLNGDCNRPGAPLASAIVPVPQPAPPVIVAAAAPAAPTGSPIGQANGADIYMTGPGDSDASYPKGTIFRDASGTYQKMIFITPFGTSRFWQKLQ